jgi:uncharacterized protein YqhQ
MMRGKKAFAMAVRRPCGDIVMIEKPISTLTTRFPVLKWPIIRGVTAFCSSMALGFTALSQSADIAFEGIEEEASSRFEKWLTEKFGDKLNDFLKYAAMVFAIIFGLGLFMLLPAAIGSFIQARAAFSPAFTGIVEGFLRIFIFVAYVFVVSRSKDIRRVFQYHGAEHKAIICHEKNLPLTHENVAACSRLHKRCGTSFMLVVMVITMILFIFVPITNVWLRFASRIAFLPLIAGLSYEVSVKWAGRRDNFLVRAIIFPGMLMQRMTTAEPDEKQIEVAVTALERAIAQESDEWQLEKTEHAPAEENT